MNLAIETREIRKARGAFFTPSPIASFMVKWAIRKRSDTVLEPSCGDASFLLPAADRLVALGAREPELTGYDVHGPTIASARAKLAGFGKNVHIKNMDFFEVPATGQYEAVVGNPPYLRYQSFTGNERHRGLKAARQHGVQLTQLSNAWAAFTIHAAQSANRGGRLALVLPSALLTANYAGPVREFLVRRFRSVQLVLFANQVFPGVQEDVVLLLAEGDGPAEGLRVAKARDENALNNLEWQLLPLTKRWSHVLLAPQNAATHTEVTKDFVQLDAWGHLELGTVSGNNKFFTLSAEDVHHWNLSPSDLRKVVPAGSRHVRGITLTKKALGALSDSGKRTFLFYPHPDKPLSTQASDYIQSGESMGVPNGYKCRNRALWWRVPLVGTGHLLFTYMSGACPRLISNRAKAHVLNSMHTIRLHTGKQRDGMNLLPLAALNSASLLGAELVGRSYGGGVLKMEPREARRMPLPSPAQIRRAAPALRACAPIVSKHLRTGDMELAAKAVDEALLVRTLGLRRNNVRIVREAWRELKNRRRNRGRTRCQ